jgi:DNA-binding response OmpR family regulator
MNRLRHPLAGYVLTAALLAVCTGIIALIRWVADTGNISIVYLLAVITSAVVSGRGPAVVERRRVRAQGRGVHLTPTEFELLRAFIQHPDKLMTDRALLQQVWGPDYGLQTHYLHVYMSRLRAKIEEDPERPRHLVTEPGVGYRLVTEAE